jgi:diaminopimelate decarboxylase
MKSPEKLKYERPYLKKLNAGSMNKFGSPASTKITTEIEGIPVRDLLDQYGSPLFVLSERQIRRNYRSALRAFQTRYPAVQFAWSYKTNYLNAVCNIFHQEGSWAEVVSGLEYKKALGNGIKGDQVIFNGPAKQKKDILLAIENDSLIHIDNLDEIYLILDACNSTNKVPRVAIRVNMDTGVYPLWDRFGFNYENNDAWQAISRIITSGKMRLVGLHCHIGTFMLSVQAYRIAASKMCDLAMRCNTLLNNPISYIDMGGGFPSTNTLKGAYLPGVDTVPSMDDFAEAITSTILQFGFKQDELPLLILECGRVLIDDAGFLAGTVIAGKRLSDGRHATIVDFGVNTLFTAFWYDHQVTPVQETSAPVENSVLYGPLCMNIDVLRENISLPLLNAGDKVVVHKVGAYNMTQWMQFITSRPGIVLIDENRQVRQVRLPETLEYLETPELIPEHLKLK